MATYQNLTSSEKVDRFLREELCYFGYDHGHFTVTTVAYIVFTVNVAVVSGYFVYGSVFAVINNFHVLLRMLRSANATLSRIVIIKEWLVRLFTMCMNGRRRNQPSSTDESRNQKILFGDVSRRSHTKDIKLSC